MSTRAQPQPHTPHEVKCDICGGLFTAKRPNAKHCSNACSAKAKQARAAIRATTNPAEETPPVQTPSLEFLEDADLEWFGLSKDPFDNPRNPEDLFLTSATISAERAMERAVIRHQMLALCGDPGSGKSTLLRRFISRAARESQVRVLNPATLDRSTFSHTTLEVAILRDLANVNAANMAPEARSDTLRRMLTEQGQAGMFPVLVLDEAHLLKNKALLAVKQLWDSSSLRCQLAVFMMGHRTLSGALRSDPELRELAGRTKIIDLEPLDIPVRGVLTPANTTAYLKWRFSRVEGDATKVFSPGAIEKIAQRGEHPLWINNFAVLAMRFAHRQGERIVTIEHVGKV